MVAGIGQSKKLARRHAAENMLALMIDKGININPSSKKQKVNKPLILDHNSYMNNRNNIIM